MKSESAARKMVILMADDDPDDQLLARDAILECKLNGELRCVADGEELLDYLHRRGSFTEPDISPRPHLILLDLNMPRKDGREALREIKANPDWRRIPVVVFTTSRADSDIEGIYALGANSYVSKPASFEALQAVMRALDLYWFQTVKLPAPAP